MLFFCRGRGLGGNPCRWAAPDGERERGWRQNEQRLWLASQQHWEKAPRAATAPLGLRAMAEPWERGGSTEIMLICRVNASRLLGSSWICTTRAHLFFIFLFFFKWVWHRIRRKSWKNVSAKDEDSGNSWIAGKCPFRMSNEWRINAGESVMRAAVKKEEEKVFFFLWAHPESGKSQYPRIPAHSIPKRKNAF